MLSKEEAFKLSEVVRFRNGIPRTRINYEGDVYDLLKIIDRETSKISEHSNENSKMPKLEVKVVDESVVMGQHNFVIRILADNHLVMKDEVKFTSKPNAEIYATNMRKKLGLTTEFDITVDGAIIGQVSAINMADAVDQIAVYKDPRVTEAKILIVRATI